MSVRMGGLKVDPAGPMNRLSEPDWADGERRRPPHGRGPVRVADAPPPGKAGPTAADRKALVDRIASGKSKVGIDVSDLTPNPAAASTAAGRELLASAEKYRQQYTQYLKDLANTDVGFRLLSDLDKSPHPTVVKFDLRAQDNRTGSPGTGGASNGRGEAATITMNPKLTNFDDNQGRRDLPWMTEREKYGFYHELVHAWHITKGTQATGSHKDVRNSEWQTTGLGPNADPKVSDNAIRRAMGKAERPGHSGKTY